MNGVLINSIINTDFQPVSLDEMKEAELMNRVDTKFVFSANLLPDILNECKKEYKILEVNSIRNHLYDSLYYDTPDFMMYHAHHNQRLNRYKVRFRKYVNSNGLTFFEIKFKNNKEKTLKTRKRFSGEHYVITDSLNEFLRKNSCFNTECLLPVLSIEYYRMTLVHKNNNERVTIDTLLHFKNSENEISFDNIVISEVKRSSYSDHTTFLKLMRKMHIREGGLSKYCTGMALTNPGLKKNNFMPKIRYFQKINKS
jgi:VTC domain.